MIYECCPFFNENLIADIKIAEGRKWIDEIHITESNKTFTFMDKPYNFAINDSIVKYHKIDGNTLFKKPKWGISRYYPFLKLKKYQWYNEGVQRNMSCAFIEPKADDIVILSDIDEIIDSKCADILISEVKKRNIITVKLHFTCFYFNLYLKNRGGPDGFGYRVYIMTGEHFNKMKTSSDQLRKMGERRELLEEVYCMDMKVGFHHSWLGDVEQIQKKLISYAHGPEDHDGKLFKNGQVNMDRIRECIKNKESLYGPGPELYSDDGVKLMESVEQLRGDYDEFFI